MEGAPEIPPFFVCPISLQIMKDPVTVSTGATYDRESIVRWLSAYGRSTCPVTNQPLDDHSLTPNSTLLRLILSWVADHPAGAAAGSTARAPPPVDVPAVLDLVGKLREPETQVTAMRRIGELVQKNGDYRTCLEEAGVTSLLSQLVGRRNSSVTATADDRGGSSSSSSSSPSVVDEDSGGGAAVADEATTLLHTISPSPRDLKKIAESGGGELIRSLSHVTQRGSYHARIHAVLLLKSVFRVVDDRYKAELPTDLFDGVAEMLKDQNSQRSTTMAALSILMEVAPYGRNRTRAVEAGTVAVLVELLLEEGGDRRKCEAMLALAEVMCKQAEGRSALVEHSAGVAAVSAKVLTVSQAATDRAVRVLLLLSRFCGGGGVVEEMMAVGAVAKLCTVVQLGGGRRTKEKAKEIFSMHLKSWSKFPCFPSNCIP